jgi:hypothetical protein
MGFLLGMQYLDRIDTFFKKARRYRHTTKIIKISNVIEERDKCLFDKIRKNSEHNLYISYFLLRSSDYYGNEHT